MRATRQERGNASWSLLIQYKEVLPPYTMRPGSHTAGGRDVVHVVHHETGDGPTMPGMRLQVQWKRYCLFKVCKSNKKRCCLNLLCDLQSHTAGGRDVVHIVHHET